MQHFLIALVGFKLQTVKMSLNICVYKQVYDIRFLVVLFYASNNLNASQIQMRKHLHRTTPCAAEIF